MKFTKIQYKAIMHAQLVSDIVESNYKGVDKSEIIKQSYKLMIENDGYDLDTIIEIMMEKAQDEKEQQDEEVCALNGGLDPAFISWEDCNSQFV